MGPMKRQIMAFVFGACFSGAATLGIGAGPFACWAEDTLGMTANKAAAKRTLEIVFHLVTLQSGLLRPAAAGNCQAMVIAMRRIMVFDFIFFLIGVFPVI